MLGDFGMACLHAVELLLLMAQWPDLDYAHQIVGIVTDRPFNGYKLEGSCLENSKARRPPNAQQTSHSFLCDVEAFGSGWGPNKPGPQKLCKRNAQSLRK